MSAGGSRQSQQSEQQSRVWEGQAPFLQNLYARADALQQQQFGQTGQIARQNLAPIQAAGFPAWQQAVSGQVNPAQLSAGLEAMGTQFSRETLPQIRGGAMQSGGLGGSRQGIAEGLAAGELARQQRGLFADLSGQASQRQMGALQLAPSMFDLSMAPTRAEWLPLQMGAGALGGTTVLGSGSSSGSGSSFKAGLK